MGAVFALYSAWYFWIPKILGVDYNRSWGKVHFWILFIGVNVTFFPQHFLGLQGMPRRISDYADAFAGWNMISSFGSIISVIATFLFLHVLYTQLTTGKPVLGYLWSMPSYFSDALQALIIRSFDSLEWALSSPPKPHAFVSLPVQSSNFWLISRISILLLTAFFTFALRWPFKSMLDNLDMLAYYPIINTLISLVLAFCVTTALLKELSFLRIGVIICTGTILPMLVFFFTNNFDSVCCCIEALAVSYTLTTLIFYPIESGSFLLAASSSDNIGSSADAGVGSSTGAGIDSSSHSTSEQEKLDEAIKATQEKLKSAEVHLDFLTFQDNLKLTAAQQMEIQKKRILDGWKKSKISPIEMKEQMNDMENHYIQQLDLEIQLKQLLIEAGNSPHAASWREKIESPGVLLDLVQKSGVHAIEISKDQRKNIYNQCKEAIKYQPYPKEMTLTPKLNKQVSYLNILARIELEQAALDATKKVNPSVIPEEHLKTSKASLKLAHLLVSKRAQWLFDQEFNDEEREKCYNSITSFKGDTYYKPLVPKKNKKKSIKWPINHDNDVD